MQTTQLLSLAGEIIMLAAQKLEAFKSTLHGKVLTEEDEGFHESRKVWNGMIDRRPGLIVQCADVSDVINTVKFVSENRLLLSVKCGGHNFGGLSVCEKGVMIDLSKMRTITVDAAGKKAKVAAGALLADLDKATQEHGLAVTSGTVSHTGVAGLTLGGGQGWMMNKYGLTCDNLLKVEIVTADGKLLSASETENEDLFWALRGGGGNFGVVTSFEYKLVAVGPTIPAGMIIYPIGHAKEVLRFFREYSMDTPDDLTLLAGILCLPDGTPAIAIVAGWFGNREEGIEVLKSLREFGSPIADMISEMPYLNLQSIFDAAVPYGMPRYGKMGYVQDLSDEFIDTIIDHWNIRTSPYSLILLNTMKGAVTRIDAADTAFYHRQQQWHYDVFAQWTGDGDHDTHISWARNCWKNTVNFTSGASVNFLGADDGQDRVRLSFGSNYDRLSEIKGKYDPDNLFRLNANILPKILQDQFA